MKRNEEVIQEEDRKVKRSKRFEKSKKRRKVRLSKDELFDRKWN